MSRRTIFKATSIALLASVSGIAATAQEFQGANGTSVTIYGQFNLGIQSFDDGEDTTTNLVDSGVSTSRLGLNYDVPFGEDLLRFNFETALGLPRSARASQLDDPEFDWRRTDLRKFEFIYTSSAYGKFSFGQGSMVTDGMSGEAITGTSVVATPNPTDLAGSFQFRTASGDLSGIEINDAFTDFDGPRRFRVRYDTPSFAGFTLGAAYGEEILNEDDDNTYYDIGLRYANTFGDVAFKAGIGQLWQRPDEGSTKETLVGSFGIKHAPTGISFNVAGGDEKDSGRYGWYQLGWEGDLTEVGSTAFSIDYWDGKDFNADGSSSEALTFAAVQRIDAYSLEVYAAYRRYSYDDDADSYQDADLFFLGTRWRF